MTSSSTAWREDDAATSRSGNRVDDAMWVSMPWCSRMACANAFLWNLFGVGPTVMRSSPAPSSSSAGRLVVARSRRHGGRRDIGDAEANLGDERNGGSARATVPSARAAASRADEPTSRSAEHGADARVDGFRSFSAPQAPQRLKA